MWILKVYKKFEVLPDIYDAKEIHRQYFVDEDSVKAQKLADELTASYERLGYSDVFSAEVCEA